MRAPDLGALLPPCCAPSGLPFFTLRILKVTEPLLWLLGSGEPLAVNVRQPCGPVRGLSSCPALEGPPGCGSVILGLPQAWLRAGAQEVLVN